MSLPSHPVRRALYRLVTSLFASVSTILLSVYQCTLEFEVEGEDHLRLLKAKGENYVVAVWHTFVDAAVFCLHHRNLVIYSDHRQISQELDFSSPAKDATIRSGHASALASAVRGDPGRDTCRSRASCTEHLCSGIVRGPVVRGRVSTCDEPRKEKRACHQAAAGSVGGLGCSVAL